MFEPTSGQKRFKHMDVRLKVYLERHKNPGNVCMLLLQGLVDSSTATRAPFQICCILHKYFSKSLASCSYQTTGSMKNITRCCSVLMFSADSLKSRFHGKINTCKQTASSVKSEEVFQQLCRYSSCQRRVVYWCGSGFQSSFQILPKQLNKPDKDVPYRKETLVHSKT